MVIINDFPLNAEYWRAIHGFPKYEVSTDGRVRIATTGKIMQSCVRKTRYVTLSLRNDEGRSSHKVHRLVGFAFCEKKEGDIEVDHIDKNKSNNNYQNLRWVTHSGNMRNLPIQIKSSSGYQGVTYNSNGLWIARWNDMDMVQKSKAFSVNKYGEAHAKQMAINYRKQMELENKYLNV